MYNDIGFHEETGTARRCDPESTWSSLSPIGMAKPRRSVVPTPGRKKYFHSRVTRPSTCGAAVQRLSFPDVGAGMHDDV